MSAFARSDVMSVSVNLDGHQHAHERRLVRGTPAGEFEVDCAECEAWLLENCPDQWSREADKLPLTPDQERERIALKEEGDVLTQAMARAMAQSAAEIVAGRFE